MRYSGLRTDTILPESLGSRTTTEDIDSKLASGHGVSRCDQEASPVEPRGGRTTCGLVPDRAEAPHGGGERHGDCPQAAGSSTRSTCPTLLSLAYQILSGQEDPTRSPMRFSSVTPTSPCLALHVELRQFDSRKTMFLRARSRPDCRSTALSFKNPGCSVPLPEVGIADRLEFSKWQESEYWCWPNSDLGAVRKKLHEMFLCLRVISIFPHSIPFF